MSNYVKATDFAVKDSLASGSPAKVIKGTEINTELNAIQTAIATKADTNSPSFSGTPTAPTAAIGDNSTKIGTTAFVQAAVRAMYPVGTIYTSVVATNPNTLFGFGTWVAFGAGRVLVGLDSSDSLFDTVEETGGSKNAIVVTHTHGVTDSGHSHAFGGTSQANAFSSGSSKDGAVLNTGVLSTGFNTTGISIQSTGESGVNANIQPYIVVYMWKRTA